MGFGDNEVFRLNSGDSSDWPKEEVLQQLLHVRRGKILSPQRHRRIHPADCVIVLDQRIIEQFRQGACAIVRI